MRWFKWLMVLGILGVLLAGCGAKEEAAAGKQPDAVTTASLVNEQEAFVKAVSEQGKWIIATLNDLTIDKEVVVSGVFRDKDKPDGKIYRKIALYAQDENHKTTATYTLTVPKMTIKSENLRIQEGKVKGDLYVEANGFELHQTATIDGNLVFASDAVKATAKIDGKVTGKTAVQ